MRITLPILLIAGLAAPSFAVAQQAPESRFDAARFVAAPTLPAVQAAPATLSSAVTSSVRGAGAGDAAGAVSAAERRERSLTRTVLHTLGGALVGGWVGFVGSQVTLSDWDKETNSEFSAERRTWVAGGMVLGVLGSQLFRGSTAPAVRPEVEVQRPRTGRSVLTREEILESGATNVYALIQAHRREWLVPRGVNTFGEGGRGQVVEDGTPSGTLLVTPGKGNVIVYMDDIRIGEVDRLRDFLTNDIMRIEFIEPQVATYRYGSGHSHGVILLQTSLE